MGRMKVYGGSWDIPGVRIVPDPFADNLVHVEDDAQEPYFSTLPMLPARSAPPLNNATARKLATAITAAPKAKS